MEKLLFAIIFLINISSCSKVEEVRTISEEMETVPFIAAADISSYPEIAKTNPSFYDLEGTEKNFLTILKENEVNTARLRLWVDPINEHSSLEEVIQFSNSLKSEGFKLWITLHYSDTWADPGQQLTPPAWEGISFSALKDSVTEYTKMIVEAIEPDFIQVGNEINSGFLHPSGSLSLDNSRPFTELLEAGTSAVREVSADTKIILHYAGIDDADWFFGQIQNVDYDIIGLSYYPIWHGKSLAELQATMEILENTYQKQLLIAETAYPFTLEWNDWTNNIVGLEEQLILPDYPATIDGQRNFIRQIRKLISEVPNGIGFCYWGAELIAWNGSESVEGSPWENQALFDFDNKALPVLLEFAPD